MVKENTLIKRIYLYIFTTVGLILIVSGAVGVINLGLKAVIFTEANADYAMPIPCSIDENGTKSSCQEQSVNYAKIDNQRDASRNIALLLVGIPLYVFHWRILKKKAY